MIAPSKIAILELANAHVGARERTVYHFTKRDLLAFAAALVKLGPESPDSARLDALADAAGFMRGTAEGATAFRLFGSESWHADLRMAIDQDILPARPHGKVSRNN